MFDAVIVGAGFAGIGAAIQLKRLGIENFTILEREDDLGGTWYVNHYPGLAVDVPTTTYSYFFEPNPNWSRLFTPGPEIKRYADDVAANIGAGTNSVMRWCRAAGVGRDVTARDREWATRLDVMRSMNKALTEHVRDLDTTTADYRGLPRG